jgi:tryptophan-rich sensory protein
MKERPFNFKLLVFFIVLVFVLLGGIGSYFTSMSTGSDWYKSVQPSITPPNWVFPIAWNFLFATIAFSLYFVWIYSKSKKQKKKIAIFFGINFILNMLWSALFFGLHLVKLAFFELALLWISILAIMLIVKKISKESFWLLIPYLIWIAFAGVINYLAAFH